MNEVNEVNSNFLYKYNYEWYEHFECNTIIWYYDNMILYDTLNYDLNIFQYGINK
jgi:hypothetical protein